MTNLPISKYNILSMCSSYLKMLGRKKSKPFVGYSLFVTFQTNPEKLWSQTAGWLIFEEDKKKIPYKKK